MKNFLKNKKKIIFNITIKKKIFFLKIRKNYIYKKLNKDYIKFKKFDLDYDFEIIKNIDEFLKISSRYNFSSFNKEEIINHLKNECELIIVRILEKIVHIRYMSFNIKSKNFLEPRFPVDFKKEATFGGGFTLPEYRRRGINNYVIYKMMKYFSEKNIKYMVYTININNNASIKSHSSFENEFIGKGYIINVLFFLIIIILKNEQ